MIVIRIVSCENGKLFFIMQRYDWLKKWPIERQAWKNEKQCEAHFPSPFKAFPSKIKNQFSSEVHLC